jgi:hypothetical protein
MLWPLRDIIAFGAEHSSLGAVVDRAAKRLNLFVSPTLFPSRPFLFAVTTIRS